MVQAQFDLADVTRLREERFGGVGRIGPRGRSYVIVDHERARQLSSSGVDSFPKVNCTKSYGRPFLAPFEVKWDISYRCNLRCAHCYSSSGPEGDVGLPSEECLRILDILWSYGVFELQILGGEPLMKRELKPVLRHACGLGFFTTLNTNGTLLTADWIDFLREVQVDAVQVSLDGIGETHDKFRGVSGAFELTLAGLRRLSASGIHAGLSVVVNATNLKELPDIIRLGADLHLDVQLLTMMPTGRGERASPYCMSPGQWGEACAIVERERRTSPNLYLDAPGLAMPAGVEMVSRNIGGSTVICGCEAGVRFLDLDPFGNVLPCLHARGAVGNVFSEPLDGIFERAYELKLKLTPPRCNECAWFQRQCFGLCFAIQ